MPAHAHPADVGLSVAMAGALRGVMSSIATVVLAVLGDGAGPADPAAVPGLPSPSGGPAAGLGARRQPMRYPAPPQWGPLCWGRRELHATHHISDLRIVLPRELDVH